MGGADRALGFVLGAMKGAAFCAIAFQLSGGSSDLFSTTRRTSSYTNGLFSALT